MACIFLRYDESFRVALHPKDLRWAANERVSEDVIAFPLGNQRGT
jgi:hypothetical protein